MKITMKDNSEKKIKDIVFKKFAKRVLELPPEFSDNFVEIDARELLMEVKKEFPNLSVFNEIHLNRIARNLAEEGKIIFAPGDAGFPNYIYNFHFRFKLPSRKSIIPSVISFDKKLCIFRCGDKTYRAQRKGGRCQILRKLWEGRRIINSNGEIKKEGQIYSIDELAIEGKFVESLDEFKRKKTIAERSVRDAIQDLRDKFSEMKAPVEIVAQNGFMLKIRE